MSFLPPLDDFKSFELIPPGDYPACLIDAKEQESKSGKGAYIKTTWKLLDGEFAGRSVFTNYNHRHENPKVVQIGLSQLKTMLKCSNIKGQPERADDLIGARCLVRIAIRKDETYGDSTRSKATSP